MSLEPYSAGFVSIFITELKERNSPSYPEIRWFAALRAADQAAGIERVRRSVEHQPDGKMVYRYELERAGVAMRERRTYDLSRSVGNSASAWLAKQGMDTTFPRY